MLVLGKLSYNQDMNSWLLFNEPLLNHQMNHQMKPTAQVITNLLINTVSLCLIPVCQGKVRNDKPLTNNFRVVNEATRPRKAAYVTLKTES
jgi:hypothetical protein